MLLKNSPFFRLLIPLITGILVSWFTSAALPVPSYLVFITACLAGTIFSLSFLPGAKRRDEFIFVFFVDLFLFLFALNETNAIFIQQKNVESLANTNIEFKAIITEKPKASEHSINSVLQVKEIRSNDVWQVFSFKLTGRFDRDSLSESLSIGDAVAVTARLQSLTGTLNAYEFDYKKYMALQGVYLQARIKSSQWHKTENGNEYLIYILASKAREHLLQIFRDLGIADQEFAVLSALTIGYKDELDRELKQAFIASGTIHILVVSGMHVGMIYLMASFFLVFLDKKLWTKWLKAMIILLIVWFYILITGLSASILRAGIMITMVILADVLQRQSNIYNTLAASIFILLVSNPAILFDVGFQLSYLAVIGIIAFYGPIYNLFRTDRLWLDKIWGLTAVSIAAQIATFPITLYYFNQFPNYFLLSNLIMIPYTTVLIYMAIGLFIISPIPYISVGIAKLLIFLTHSLNHIVYYLESLPGAVCSNIPWSAGQSLVTYIFIGMVSTFIITRKFSHLFGSLICVAVFLMLMSYSSYKAQCKQELMIWNISGQSLYTVTHSEKMEVITSLTEDLAANRIKKAVNLNHIQDVKIYNLNTLSFDVLNNNQSGLHYTDHGLISGKKSIVFLCNNRFVNMVSSKSYPVDILIVSGNTNQMPLELLNIFTPSVIVLDGSLNYKQSKPWETIALIKGIKVINIKKQGSFVTEL